ncbi:hypothetical protein HMPREF0971_01033 [Segatella oris F0302]|uniref:Lipoprotein n=1 Tax=Segatella oris F0302 TaxID=649760 RepID=D1QPY6_9BACT|nr:hypothetical protein [Segatella oris]EFB32580.1 hypothetical protein HMPREF0971_01033 [Segatella oris F0302]
MKNLFILLVLSFFLSCDDKIDNVISIEQADSHFPVLMKVDDDTIQYIDFPVFKIKKTIDKKIKLSGDGYFYNAKYSKLPKGWLFNGNIFVNAKGKLIRPTLNDELRKLSKDKCEFVFYVRYKEAAFYLTRFKQLREKNVGIIQMQSIQGLKKEDKNFIDYFLLHDSITMSFWYERHFNKHRINHINLPIHVR